MGKTNFCTLFGLEPVSSQEFLVTSTWEPTVPTGIANTLQEELESLAAQMEALGTNPQRTPRSKALWSGLTNQRFPLIRPYQILSSEGGICWLAIIIGLWPVSHSLAVPRFPLSSTKMPGWRTRGWYSKQNGLGSSDLIHSNCVHVHISTYFQKHVYKYIRYNVIVLLSTMVNPHSSIIWGNCCSIYILTCWLSNHLN